MWSGGIHRMKERRNKNLIIILRFVVGVIKGQERSGCADKRELRPRIMLLLLSYKIPIDDIKKGT